MENKTKRRVLIDPLLMVLKSRRVIIALVSLLVGMLVLAVPQLEALHSELLVLVVSLALAWWNECRGCRNCRQTKHQ